MADKSKRRDFLKATTAAGVGYWASAGSTQAESRSPNERVNQGRKTGRKTGQVRFLRPPRSTAGKDSRGE